jgi:hypothetical protein
MAAAMASSSGIEPIKRGATILLKNSSNRSPRAQPLLQWSSPDRIHKP